MIKLTDEQKEKVLEITTEHNEPEKYMVILKAGYENYDYSMGGVAYFNTPKEVKKYIDGAKRVNLLV